MIIIGSVAIRYWYPDFNRLPKDIDYAVISSKQYKSTRSTEYQYFKVEQDEVVVVCAGYNGEQEYCTFPISYLYLSKEDLVKAVKAEQKADKIKAQLLKEEKEIEERKQNIFLFNKLKEKLNL